MAVSNLIKKTKLLHFKQSFKLIVLFILVPVFITSCWHKTKPTNKHHKPNIDYHALFGKIQGTWISYEYILNLKKTNSPSESAPFMGDIFSFTIDSTRLLNDTLYCLAWVNGHQERDMWIAFDADDSLPLHNVGLNRSNEQSGPLLNDNYTKIKIDSQFLTIYTSLFDSVRYVYFGEMPRGASSDYPLKYYTTSALFNSEYFTSDSTIIFGSSLVSFDRQEIGRIYGSPVYDSFDINVVALSQNDSIDYIELFDSKKQNESRSFTYKIKNNALLIYPDNEQKPCVLYKVTKSDSINRKLDRIENK